MRTAVSVGALHAPLCPAGHLPHKEGDRLWWAFCSTSNVPEERDTPKLPISLLVGVAAAVAKGDGKPTVWVSKLQGAGKPEERALRQASQLWSLT